MPNYNPAAPHIVTRQKQEQVRRLAALGVPQDQIGRVIGCDAKTLRRHYRDILDTAAAEANAAVAGRLFKLAMDGDVAACIFWTKARMGWSDRLQVHHTTGPALTHEERLQMLERGPEDEQQPAEGRVVDMHEDESGALVPVEGRDAT